MRKEVANYLQRYIDCEAGVIDMRFYLEGLRRWKDDMGEITPYLRHFMECSWLKMAWSN